jgi:hypothetical protein
LADIDFIIEPRVHFGYYGYYRTISEVCYASQSISTHKRATRSRISWVFPSLPYAWRGYLSRITRVENRSKLLQCSNLQLPLYAPVLTPIVVSL